MDGQPRHLSFVLDGNRRWAKKLGKLPWEGHLMALDSIINIVDWSIKNKIQYLTLYLFSTENWGRSEEELAKLFGPVAKVAVDKKFPQLLTMGARINILGSTDKLPIDLARSLDKLVADSRDNSGIVVNFCIDYGARDELVKAVRSIVNKRITEIDESVISNELFTVGMPDVDMMIRTGGDMRLSNFLLWQQAYSELYFTDKFLPEFDEEEFNKALAWYAGVERRFGK